MRRVDEPTWVIEAVATRLTCSTEHAAKLITLIHDEIDEWVLAGGSVFVPPFSLAYETDEVAQRFADSYRTASDEQLQAWYVSDAESTSQWLDVPLELYDEWPVASGLLIAVGVADRLDLGDNPRRVDAVTEEILDAIDAWAATFSGGRRYHVSAIGLERNFSAWLVAHLDVLETINYPVTLVRAEHRFADGRRADLVCRFHKDTAEAVAGDWLVVELKAVAGYRKAIDQLDGYVTTAREEVATGNESVFGLLLADGVSPGTASYAREHGLDARSLTELGYRFELARPAAAALTLPNLDAHTMGRRRRLLSS